MAESVNQVVSERECVNVSMNVLQLNCQRARGVMYDLGECVLRGGISACLLQEPYVCMGKVCGLPAGTRVFASVSGRACVAVFDKEYECMNVQVSDFEDGVCVWMKGVIGELLCVSLYCRPSGDMNECVRYLDGILGYARGKRLLIGMDANATSDLWFSKERGRSWNNERRGECLTEWILDKGMSVVNEYANDYTFSGARGESDIDVTLYKGSGCMCEWRLMSDWCVSDHNPIVLRMTDKKDESCMNENRVKKWSARKCDWGKYKGLILSSALGFGYDRYRGLSAGERVRLMNEWITAANDECMERVGMCKSRKNVAWWTRDLEKKRREVRMVRKRYQNERKRTGDPERRRWNEWKECMRDYKVIMKDAKEDDWQRFVSRESMNDPWGKVYKVCMGKMDKCSLSSLRGANGMTETWSESASVLMNEFFPPDDGVPIPEEEQDECEDEMVGFSMNELKNAIKGMSWGKSPGMDGITNEMIKRVWLVVPDFLLSMYDSCMREGSFPKCWKEARVIALLKGNDKDKAEPRSYRPISLLSGLGKVLERMMIARLNVHMNERWNECQFGFRSGKCTEDAWARVKSIVSESVRKHVIGVFVDFKSAFDCLLWRICLAKLRESGCMNAEMKLWRDYFRERWVRMCNGMDEVVRKVERGCPQGSISGPPVWNLCMNELLNILNELGVYFAAYADDLTIIVEGDTRDEVERRASEVMKVVYEWGMRVGVNVSEEKTVCMVLKGGMSMLNRRVHVRLSESDERVLKFVDCVRYLGVNVGVNMNFRVHVNGMRKRVNGVVGKLRRVMRKDWGLKKNVCGVLAKGLMLPAVMYGASVWYELLRLKGVREELNRCQRVVMYVCTRVCKTVSTEAMQIISGSLPWDIECMRQSARYKVRKSLGMNDFDLVMDEELDGLSLYERRELVDKRAYERWQSRWDESEKGRVTYEWIRNVCFAERTRKFDPGLRVCYLLTGHGSLNAFLHARGLSGEPGCVCGYEREDWLHVLCECDLYEHFRDIDGMNVVKRGNDWDVSSVLSSRESYECMSKFAERAFKMRSIVMARMNDVQ